MPVGTTTRRPATRPPAELAALLATVPLFARLPVGQRELIGSTGHWRRVRRGEIVVGQGQPGDAVFVVARGSLLVHRVSRSGERRALSVIEAPGSFGELSLLDGRPRSASVEALEPAELLVISRAAFLDLLARDPGLVNGVLRELGRLVRRLTDQVTDSNLLDLPGRVAKALVRIIDDRPPHAPQPPVVSLSQGKLAELAGGSRQSVNGALSTLASRGFVQVSGRRIIVVDVDGLRTRAGVGRPAPGPRTPA